MSYCGADRWNGTDPSLPPGLLALFTNSHRSNIKALDLTGLIDYVNELEDYPQIAKLFQQHNVGDTQGGRPLV